MSTGLAVARLFFFSFALGGALWWLGENLVKLYFEYKKRKRGERK